MGATEHSYGIFKTLFSTFLNKLLQQQFCWTIPVLTKNNGFPNAKMKCPTADKVFNDKEIVRTQILFPIFYTGVLNKIYNSILILTGGGGRV